MKAVQFSISSDPRASSGIPSANVATPTSNQPSPSFQSFLDAVTGESAEKEASQSPRDAGSNRSPTTPATVDSTLLRASLGLTVARPPPAPIATSRAKTTRVATTELNLGALAQFSFTPEVARGGAEPTDVGLPMGVTDVCERADEPNVPEASAPEGSPMALAPVPTTNGDSSAASACASQLGTDAHAVPPLPPPALLVPPGRVVAGSAETAVATAVVPPSSVAAGSPGETDVATAVVPPSRVAVGSPGQTLAAIVVVPPSPVAVGSPRETGATVVPPQRDAYTPTTHRAAFGAGVQGRGTEAIASRPDGVPRVANSVDSRQEAEGTVASPGAAASVPRPRDPAADFDATRAARPRDEKTDERAASRPREANTVERNSTATAGAEALGAGQGAPTQAASAQAQPTSELIAPAMAAASGSSLTPVVQRGVGGLTPSLPGGVMPATLAGANLAIIQVAAHGSIDTPELGRVSVTARAGDSGVDVQVLAEKRATADVLLGHVVAMEVDARAETVSLHRFEISSDETAGTAASTPDYGSGGAPSSDDTSDRPSAPRPAEPAAPLASAPARTRARIVL